MRFVVTELEGFLSDDSRYPGLSVQVCDTAFNHRIVRSWRSEEHLGDRDKLRARAHAAADRLNRGEPIDEYVGPHGTRTAYQNGCRCDDCKAAQHRYMRAWRLRRREAAA